MNPIGLQFYNNLINDLVKEGKYVLIFSCPLEFRCYEVSKLEISVPKLHHMLHN